MRTTRGEYFAIGLDENEHRAAGPAPFLLLRCPGRATGALPATATAAAATPAPAS